MKWDGKADPIWMRTPGTGINEHIYPVSLKASEDISNPPVTTARNHLKEISWRSEISFSGEGIDLKK